MADVAKHEHNDLYQRRSECGLEREKIDLKFVTLQEQLRSISRQLAKNNWLTGGLLLALVGGLVKVMFF